MLGCAGCVLDLRTGTALCLVTADRKEWGRWRYSRPPGIEMVGNAVFGFCWGFQLGH